jgi:hypothetical protein
VSSGQFTDIKIGFHRDKKGEGSEWSQVDTDLATLREFSEFHIVHPYVIYCKGNKEIILRNTHYPDQIFRLVLDDYFLCFVNASKGTFSTGFSTNIYTHDFLNN